MNQPVQQPYQNQQYDPPIPQEVLNNAQPQWQQPQSIPQQLPPTQMAPPQPVGVQPPAQQVIRPPEANSSTFVPDVKTKEILDRTYPEMLNAMVNLALKKFSEDPDYAAYFVREEFRSIAEAKTVKEEPKQATKNSGSQADFSSW